MSNVSIAACLALVAVRGHKFDAAPLLKPPLGTGAFVVVEGGAYIFLSARTS